MSIYDKVNIYVPIEVGTLLERDMEMFEIYKSSGKSFNWNRFLSMLIRGYYDTYVLENKALYDRVLSALESTPLNEAQRKDAANSILNNVIRPDGNKRSRRGSRHLSLKPTESTDDLIQRISGTSDDYISRYFRGMLMSYCEKSFSQRERIVFRETYEKLRKYCRDQQPIYLSTVLEDGVVHEVVPYTMAIGPEEMFNFLLCQEENAQTHEMEAKAYGLRRIKRVNVSDNRIHMQPTVLEHLKIMERTGPQYAINDDDEICVKLTDDGLDAYRRIYFGKPRYSRMEKRNDGYYQYYRCSKEQVFLYFRRFDPRDAQIIEPKSLRKRMICYYESGMKAYDSIEKKS